MGNTDSFTELSCANTGELMDASNIAIRGAWAIKPNLPLIIVCINQDIDYLPAQGDASIELINGDCGQFTYRNLTPRGDRVSARIAGSALLIAPPNSKPALCKPRNEIMSS